MAENTSKMTDAIGGYFGLADRDIEKGHYPVEGARVNTARNALEYILLQLPDAKMIYLPLYTCEAIVEPLKILSVSFNFYHINMNLEMKEEVPVEKGTYVIVNNYFGVKDAYVAQMAEKYGKHLIVDNAQALFAPVLQGVKAIYSARKFVGVADGGFAVGVPDLPLLMYDEDTTEHDSHLLIRKQREAEAGFRAFRENEKQLSNQSIYRMADSTQDILQHIDYEKVVEKRRENYRVLHDALKELNQLQLPNLDSFACPMVYPFLPKDSADLRQRLIDNRIYVARYWPNVLNWCRPDDIEEILAKDMIPLPIDQRYGEEEMKRIIEIIKKYLTYGI